MHIWICITRIRDAVVLAVHIRGNEEQTVAILTRPLVHRRRRRLESSPVNLVALFVTCRLRRIAVDTQIIFTFTIAIKIILIFRFERSYKLTMR